MHYAEVSPKEFLLNLDIMGFHPHIDKKLKYKINLPQLGLGLEYHCEIFNLRLLYLKLINIKRKSPKNNDFLFLSLLKSLILCFFFIYRLLFAW